VLLQDLFIFDK